MDSNMIVILALFGGLVFNLIFHMFERRSKNKWFCNKMGWHLAPISQGFDGASFNGKCPRCGKSVMQDSQGNWF